MDEIEFGFKVWQLLHDTDCVCTHSSLMNMYDVGKPGHALMFSVYKCGCFSIVVDLCMCLCV